MPLTDVNDRELCELIEHLESRPDMWRNVHESFWARYNHDDVVMLLDIDHDVEVLWSDHNGKDTNDYTNWLLDHFTSRGIRLRLQALMPQVGPNMIDSIVQLLDGWSTTVGDDVRVLTEHEENDEEAVKRAPPASRPTTITPPRGEARHLSPYLARLIRRVKP